MFIGREKKLKFLEEKLNSESFEFGVLHGRRRVGKTVLIKEAIKNKNAIYFQAHQANMQINLELLSSLYGDYKKIGKITYNSMYELFRQFFLEPNLILVIDEFTYLTEIDICIKTIDRVHIYECKWTNKEVDVCILNKLKEKGKELKVTKYGIFSKSGFSKEITNKEYELITVDELYQIK